MKLDRIIVYASTCGANTKKNKKYLKWDSPRRKKGSFPYKETRETPKLSYDKLTVININKRE